MRAVLDRSDFFRGLGDEVITCLVGLARPKPLRAGEYLFLLGEPAESLHVVLAGRVQLCFPFSLQGTVQDISFELREPGHVLGWSALVEPYRFTLSARAAEASEVAAFSRVDLLAAFEKDPRIGYAFLRRLSQVIGRRLLNMQALWARELQRKLAGGLREGDPPQAAGPGRA